MRLDIGSLAPTAAHCLGWISVAAVALYGRQTTRNNNIIIICYHDNTKNQDNEKNIISFSCTRVTDYGRKLKRPTSSRIEGREPH